MKASRSIAKVNIVVGTMELLTRVVFLLIMNANNFWSKFENIIKNPTNVKVFDRVKSEIFNNDSLLLMVTIMMLTTIILLTIFMTYLSIRQIIDGVKEKFWLGIVSGGFFMVFSPIAIITSLITIFLKPQWGHWGVNTRSETDLEGESMNENIQEEITSDEIALELDVEIYLNPILNLGLKDELPQISEYELLATYPTVEGYTKTIQDENNYIDFLLDQLLDGVDVELLDEVVADDQAEEQSDEDLVENEEQDSSEDEVISTEMENNAEEPIESSENIETEDVSEESVELNEAETKADDGIIQSEGDITVDDEMEELPIESDSIGEENNNDEIVQPLEFEEESSQTEESSEENNESTEQETFESEIGEDETKSLDSDPESIESNSEMTQIEEEEENQEIAPTELQNGTPSDSIINENLEDSINENEETMDEISNEVSVEVQESNDAANNTNEMNTTSENIVEDESDVDSVVQEFDVTEQNINEQEDATEILAENPSEELITEQQDDVEDNTEAPAISEDSLSEVKTDMLVDEEISMKVDANDAQSSNEYDGYSQNVVSSASSEIVVNDLENQDDDEINETPHIDNQFSNSDVVETNTDSEIATMINEENTETQIQEVSAEQEIRETELTTVAIEVEQEENTDERQTQNSSYDEATSDAPIIETIDVISTEGIDNLETSHDDKTLIADELRTAFEDMNIQETDEVSVGNDRSTTIVDSTELTTTYIELSDSKDTQISDSQEMQAQQFTSSANEIQSQEIESEDQLLLSPNIDTKIDSTSLMTTYVEVSGMNSDAGNVEIDTPIKEEQPIQDILISDNARTSDSTAIINTYINIEETTTESNLMPLIEAVQETTAVESPEPIEQQTISSPMINEIEVILEPEVETQVEKTSDFIMVATQDTMQNFVNNEQTMISNEVENDLVTQSEQEYISTQPEINAPTFTEVEVNMDEVFKVDIATESGVLTPEIENTFSEIMTTPQAETQDNINEHISLSAEPENNAQIVSPVIFEEQSAISFESFESPVFEEPTPIYESFEFDNKQNEVVVPVAEEEPLTSIQVEAEKPVENKIENVIQQIQQPEPKIIYVQQPVVDNTKNDAIIKEIYQKEAEMSAQLKMQMDQVQQLTQEVSKILTKLNDEPKTVYVPQPQVQYIAPVPQPQPQYIPPAPQPQPQYRQQTTQTFVAPQKATFTEREGEYTMAQDLREPIYNVKTEPTVQTPPRTIEYMRQQEQTNTTSIKPDRNILERIRNANANPAHKQNMSQHAIEIEEKLKASAADNEVANRIREQLRKNRK